MKREELRKQTHYVSNKDFYAAYIEWYKQIAIAKEAGKPEPEIPKYIAECIYKICSRLAYRPNFFNYSYKEEMVGDALENCIRVARNFNAERSDNPFSYITTIAFNAFLRRIEKEKKESKVKGLLIQQLPIEEIMEIPDSDDDDVRQYQQQYIEFLREHNYNAQTAEVKPSRKKQKEHDTLDDFME